MSRLPAVAYVCVTAVLLAIIGAMTYLTAIGSDMSEIRMVFNWMTNAGGVIVGSLGAIGGAVGAKRAGQAAEQTNGGMEARIRRAVLAALAEQQRNNDYER